MRVLGIFSFAALAIFLILVGYQPNTGSAVLSPHEKGAVILTIGWLIMSAINKLIMLITDRGWGSIAITALMLSMAAGAMHWMSPISTGHVSLIMSITASLFAVMWVVVDFISLLPRTRPY